MIRHCAAGGHHDGREKSIRAGAQGQEKSNCVTSKYRRRRAEAIGKKERKPPSQFLKELQTMGAPTTTDTRKTRSFAVDEEEKEEVRPSFGVEGRREKRVAT